MYKFIKRKMLKIETIFNEINTFSNIASDFSPFPNFLKLVHTLYFLSLAILLSC